MKNHKKETNMSKLNYPSDGIYKYCRIDIEACSNNIKKAISNCYLDIPSDFAYRNYLRNLNNTLANYYKEINSINSKIKKVNATYETLSSNLSESVKNMVPTKIKDRDRMII